MEKKISILFIIENNVSIENLLKERENYWIEKRAIIILMADVKVLPLPTLYAI